MATDRDYKTRLQADFPELKIRSVRVIGEGWNHTAVEVNDAIIFRLPRGVHNQEQLSNSVHHETAVLRALQGRLPVEIPNPLYIAPDFAYFGYPRLPGKLVNDMLAGFSKNDRTQLFKDWVDVAVSIHNALPVSQARELGVPTFNPVRMIKTASQALELTGLDAPTKAFIGKVLEEVTAADAYGGPQSFIHDDMHLLNILADPEPKRMTGLIDWTGCCVGPLAKEFSIWEWSHDNSLEQAADLYESCTGIKINLKQARLRRHVDEISDLVEQTMSGDTKGVQQSLEHIHQWIAEGNWQKA